MANRASVESFAASLQIELQVEVWKPGRNSKPGSHVHAYAPEGKAFTGSGVSEAAVWDSEISRISWRSVQLALKSELPLIAANPELED